MPFPLLAGLLGSLGGAAIGALGQHSANQANRRIAKEQREWEAEMSNTAIQRRVKDLQGAGLNPMLGYSSEASTPSVAPPRMENEAAAAGEGLSNAVQAMLARKQAANMDAQNELLRKQAQQAVSQTALNSASTFATTVAGENSQVSLDVRRELLGYEKSATAADYQGKSTAYSSGVQELRNLQLSQQLRELDVGVRKGDFEESEARRRAFKLINDNPNMTPGQQAAWSTIYNWLSK